MSTNIIGCFTQNPNRPSRAASVRYTGLGSRSTGSCCGTRVPVYIGCQMGHFPARHVSCQPMGVFKLHALRCEMVGVVLVCWSIWWKQMSVVRSATCLFATCFVLVKRQSFCWLDNISCWFLCPAHFWHSISCPPLHFVQMWCVLVIQRLVAAVWSLGFAKK